MRTAKIDLGGLGLVEADYAWITEQVMAVAQRHSRGRVVSCLEGATTSRPWAARSWRT